MVGKNILILCPKYYEMFQGLEHDTINSLLQQKESSQQPVFDILGLTLSEQLRLRDTGKIKFNRILYTASQNLVVLCSTEPTYTIKVRKQLLVLYTVHNWVLLCKMRLLWSLIVNTFLHSPRHK